MQAEKVKNDSQSAILPIISVRDVHKWYGDFHALRGINLEVQQGEVIVIVGPSGSGKSTFIRTINPHRNSMICPLRR